MIPSDDILVMHERGVSSDAIARMFGLTVDQVDSIIMFEPEAEPVSAHTGKPTWPDPPKPVWPAVKSRTRPIKSIKTAHPNKPGKAPGRPRSVDRVADFQAALAARDAANREKAEAAAVVADKKLAQRVSELENIVRMMARDSKQLQEEVKELRALVARPTRFFSNPDMKLSDLVNSAGRNDA